MPLTDAKMFRLHAAHQGATKATHKPRKVTDWDGLYVLMQPTGSMLWRFAYRVGEKQKVLALGRYPELSLREARKAADEARDLLAQGSDPSVERKAAKAKARMIATDSTFRAVADEWFKARRAKWVDSYSDRLRARLDNDLMPDLGGRLLATIEPVDVLASIRKIEQRDAPEMARRVLQMASNIFRYGVATGRCPRNPAADITGALASPKPVRHRPSLKPGELPEFMRRLGAYDGDERTRLGLELIAHTIVRTSEARFAHRDEFEDLHSTQPLWRIPAQRMKMRRDHLVPLSPRAADIVRRLLELAGNKQLLFAADTKSGVISENTLIYAIYRMGYHSRASVHGLRSTASTILNEHEFNRDWIEMQLAHSELNVRSIYNAAEWISGRRVMLTWWSSFLEHLKAGRNLDGTLHSDPANEDRLPEAAAAVLRRMEDARG
ncbi:MAG: integrase arm-type DNA-binding domain-containing protein [Phenylobacterium sp.]|nr:integrase arm-type DNA-binding domain-containing protein [Phenylobacterium sp.]